MTKLFFFGLLVILTILFLKKKAKEKMRREWEKNPDPILAQILQIKDEFFYKLCIDIGVISEEKDSQDGSVLKRCVGMFNNQKVQLDLRLHQESIPAAPPVMERRKKVLFPPSDEWRKKVPIKKYEVLEIRIPVKQNFWLRMNRERLQEEDTQEIQIGNASLDREYVIHTNQREAAEDFLRRYSVQKHISKFPCTFEKLEIIHGEVCLTLHEPRAWGMRASHLAILLKELLVVMKQYEEHQLISIQIAVTQNTSRCPYCRGPFDEASEITIRCQNCSTVLHELCWNENAQCTTWGCRSTVAV